jgi:hypothetical protein
MVDKFGDIVGNIDDMGGYIYNMGRDSEESKMDGDSKESKMGEVSEESKIGGDSEESKMDGDSEESKMGEVSEESKIPTQRIKCGDAGFAQGGACDPYTINLGCAQGLQCQSNSGPLQFTCISSDLCGNTTKDGSKITCGPACIANDEK